MLIGSIVLGWVGSCVYELILKNMKGRFATALDGELATRYVESYRHQLILCNKDKRSATMLNENSRVDSVGNLGYEIIVYEMG